jgi:hypothetical protein
VAWRRLCHLAIAKTRFVGDFAVGDAARTLPTSHPMTARVSTLPWLFVALLGVSLPAFAGCSEDAVATDERGPDGTVPPQTNDPEPPNVDEVPDPRLQSIQGCADRVANGHGFQVLSTEARAPESSACGDVAFLDAAGAAIVWPIEASAPQTIAGKAKQIALSYKGNYLAYRGDDDVLTVVGLRTRDESAFGTLTEATAFGFVEGAEAPTDQEALVLCSAAGGLRLAGRPAGTSPCAELHVGHGPFAVARASAGEVMVLDGRTGTVTSLPELTATKDEATHAVLDLSDDGKILLVTAWEDVPSGDTYVRQNVRVTLVDLTTLVASTPIALGSVGSNVTSATAFAVPSGRFSVALSFPTGSLWQAAGAAPVVRDTRGLLALAPTGESGLFVGPDPTGTSSNATTLLSKSLDGASPDQVVADAVGEVAGTDDLRQLVIGHIPTDGIRYPDNPGVSHAQLWNYSRVDQDGVKILATSTQPLSPLWVDASGTSLLFGALAAGPLPAVAAPADVPTETYGLYLFGPDGSRLAYADVSSNAIVTRGARAVVLENFVSGPSYRLNFATAQGILPAPVPAEILAQIDQRQTTTFDSSGVAAVVVGRGPGSNRVVLGGVVPGASPAGLD